MHQQVAQWAVSLTSSALLAQEPAAGEQSSLVADEAAEGDDATLVGKDLVQYPLLALDVAWYHSTVAKHVCCAKLSSECVCVCVSMPIPQLAIV